MAIIAMLCGTRAYADGTTTEVTLTEEYRAMMRDLMEHTKVNVVTDPGGPASKYRADDDSMTLEIVMLSKASDGSSRVSDDGEVIFMRGDTRSADQQTLFTTAFYLKTKRRLSEPNKSQEPAR